MDVAKAQKMNTELRRSIFVVLMTSQDYVDAFERLQRLNLKEQQEREIIRVLLHCCGQEKTFNPYYAYLLEKFCGLKHSFRKTVQFCLWDFFKVLKDQSVRKIRNIVMLLAHLIRAETVPISVLKVVNFHELDEQGHLFFQLLLTTLLLDSPAEKVKLIFGRAGASKDSAPLIDGLSFYFHYFVKKALYADEPARLLERLAIARSVLRLPAD